MLIWVTNDGDKVPVKMETISPFGKVTVELVSAETQHSDRPETQKQFTPPPYSAKNNLP
jgi:hypothetical protein